MNTAALSEQQLAACIPGLNLATDDPLLMLGRWLQQWGIVS